MFLCDVPQRPLHMEPGLEGHIVYTTHEYDWYKNSVQSMYEFGQALCGLSVIYVGLLLILSLALLAISHACPVMTLPRRRLRCWPRLRGLYVEVALAVLSMAAFLLSLLVIGRAVIDPCQPGEIHVVSFPLLVISPLWLLGLVFSARLSCVLLRTYRPVVTPDNDEEKPIPVAPERVGEDGIEMPELNYVEGDAPQNLNIIAAQGKEPPRAVLERKGAAVAVP